MTTRGQHLIGQEIGSCVLERLLGYGGSSAVFLAHTVSSGEQVAVKVFLPRSTLDNQMRRNFYRRFLREARAASELEHPHILSIYAYGEHENLPYIVMPYMAGGTLTEYVQKHGPLALPEACKYIQQIAEALDYAHEHHCVHCDVKPANILLDGAGGVTLSDFGIVRVLQADQKDVESSNGTGKTSGKSGEILMGTPDYISPEQALGEALDGRTDIYSLAATLYFLLTGEPPFKSESPIALALMHVHEAPTPLGLLRADVTPQIDFVLAQAMAKWPDERFQTASAFSAALDLAIKEAGEELHMSLKHPRVHSHSGQNGISEAVVQVREVPIKRSSSSSFNLWRVFLTLGLVVLLVLGCLLTALFIGSLNSHQSHAGAGGVLVPTSVVQDAFAQQDDWPTSSTFFFQDGAYHIQNKSSLGLAMAFYSSDQFAGFHLSVTTTEVSGSLNSADYYGIIFRASADQSRYYLFEVTAWNKGQYGFLRYVNGHWTSLVDGRLTSFHTGTDQSNTLSIHAQSNTFTFAVNGVSTGAAVHDTVAAAPTMAAGEVGLVVEEQNTEVAFAHLLIASA